MDVTSGIVTVVSLVQPSNALIPMDVTSGISTLVRAVSLNANAPISVTLGIVTLSRAVQPSNASSPMYVTSGIDTLVRSVQSLKAEASTLVPFITIWPDLHLLAFAECKMNKKNKITFMV